MAIRRYLADLEGYRFLLSAKNYKNQIFAENFGELLDECYEKMSLTTYSTFTDL